MTKNLSEIEPLRSDVSGMVSGQVTQVWMLRLLPLFFTHFLLYPMFAPAGEELLTASGALWIPLFLAATGGFAYWFSATEARALECARRQGGSSLRIDERGLNLPFLALIGPARDRAIKAGRPLLVIPWIDVRGVAMTNGSKGVQSIRIGLADEPGWILAEDHVFLRCDALEEGQAERVLVLARDRAGRDKLTGAAPSEPVVRRGLSPRELRSNRRALRFVGGVMAAGGLLGGWFELFSASQTIVGYFVMLSVFVPVLWKIEVELEKASRGQ